MPEFHAEPYVYLAGLSHKSALIAWGAFYFRARSDGTSKLVDDDDLQWVHPPRCDSIGCRSKPYGPADVEVRDERVKLLRFVEPQPQRKIGLAWRPTSPRKSDFVAFGRMVVEALEIERPKKRPAVASKR